MDINQNANLIKLKQFFQFDTSVKKIMVDISVNDNKLYGEDNKIEYSDKVYKYLRYMRMQFKALVNNFNFNPLVNNEIDKLFNKYEYNLIKSETNLAALKKFYQTSISNMRLDFVNKVQENFKGYLFRKDILNVFDQDMSVNELLHAFHQYITNDEKIYQSLNVIDTKKNNYNYSVTLYGTKNNLAYWLYYYFPLDLDCGTADIISLDNKILIMIRDLGHALTIEIEGKQDDIRVSYFIPKVINPQMINKLKGVNKVPLENSEFMTTTGMFVTSEDKLLNEIYNFLNMMPTDADLQIRR